MTASIQHALTPSPAEPIRWLTVGRLLDARNTRVLTSAHIVFNADQLLYVGTESPPVNIIPGKTEADAVLPDYSALPGLIEGHAHSFLEGAELDPDKRTLYQNQDAETLYRLAAERMHTLARLGVMALRDGGDKDSVGLRLSRQGALHTPQASMARVFSPGPGIHRHGRYGSFFGKPVEHDPDIATCVKNRIADGADHIKVVPTGIINFAKGMVVAQPQFSAEEIRQLTDAAHAGDRQVMAHASGEAGVDVAIDGHVDTIEHGFFVTHEQLCKMRDQAITWVPTFAPVQVQVEQSDRMGWMGETLDNLKRIVENHAISLQKAIGLGVRIGVGSDAGSYGVAHGTGLFREMELLEQAGMPTVEILGQATFGNRALLPGNPPHGALEPGFKPRLILTEHDPMKSVSNLKLPRWVLFDGQAAHTSQVALNGL